MMHWYDTRGRKQWPPDNEYHRAFVAKPPLGQCKYEALKEISAKTILERNPCEDGFKQFVDYFGISSVKWGAAAENYIASRIVGGVGFLLENGFIQKIDKFSYSDDKIYVFVDTHGNLRKLDIYDTNEYGWCEMGYTARKGTTPAKYKTIRDAIEGGNKSNVTELNNISELIEWMKENSK